MRHIGLGIIWAVAGFSALFTALFLLLAITHFFLPTNSLPPLIATAVTNVFGPEQRSYPRGQPLDAMQRWHDECYGNNKATQNSSDAETKILYENVNGLIGRMEADQTSANTVIQNVQGNQTLFSLITVVLSLATTLVNALLSNKLIGEGRSATTWSFASIAIPAFLSAVASLNAIFVNTEASARKNQVTTAIVQLATSAGNDLMANGCINSETRAQFAAKLSGWSNTYSNILVSSISGNVSLDSKAAAPAATPTTGSGLDSHGG